MLEQETMRALLEAARKLDEGFTALPSFSADRSGREKLEEVLAATAERLTDNYPYFHPLYAGQMLKPPHPVARLAYALAMWINPNNHALDGGRATSAMEKEVVAEIAAMFGWKESLGHLCGGGTMANLEALWVAGQRKPGKKILASEQAHYTHKRVCGVLQLECENIACDDRGRMDLDALTKRVSRGDVGTVVATMGTTATGSVDPVAEILALRDKHGFRVHVDAAYGGYFKLAKNLDEPAKQAFARIHEADSIVIDPHKHGLQPYGCGCVLFQDPTVGKLYQHDSPYTYFSSAELHLGEISLECSRPGAAAAALWATQKLLPLAPGGEFARGLENGREAALALHEKLKRDERFLAAFVPQLDIVIYAPAAKTKTEVSAISQSIFREAARRNLHLALAELPARFFGAAREQQGRLPLDSDWNEGTVTVLRSVLMKPEHLEWVDRIWDVLCESAGACKLG